MKWEEAILQVFENKNGIVSLKELYNEVPIYLTEINTKDIPHNIRAYLRRLKQKKNLIKQIGLSQYALINTNYEVHFYQEIDENTVFDDFIKKLPKEIIHTYIEGMLIEIGSLSGYQTYTPDFYKVFNGKYLSELADYTELPKFTYDKSLAEIKEIDVIWFKDGFPVKTFDVENSTRFSMALQRIYELRYFKTNFYMVANQLKFKDYIKKIDKDIFRTVKDNTNFVSYNHNFELYKNAVISNRIIKSSNIFN